MNANLEKIVSLYGTKLAVTDLDRMEHKLLTDGLYQRPEFSLIAPFLVPGTVALDVGANIGVYSLFMANMLQPNGRVLAFEPFPINYDRLVKNIRLNDAAIEPILCAIGDRQETRNVHFRQQSGNALSVNYSDLRIPKDTPDGNLAIHIDRIDDILSKYNVSRISFIKIKVGRWEAQVLRGAKLTIAKHRPTILIDIIDPKTETQSSPPSDMIRNMLASWNYTVFRVHRRPIPHLRVLTEEDLEPPLHFSALCLHRSLFVNGFSPMGYSLDSSQKLSGAEIG